MNKTSRILLFGLLALFVIFIGLTAFVGPRYVSVDRANAILCTGTWFEQSCQPLTPFNDPEGEFQKGEG